MQVNPIKLPVTARSVENLDGGDYFSPRKPGYKTGLGQEIQKARKDDNLIDADEASQLLEFAKYQQSGLINTRDFKLIQSAIAEQGDQLVKMLEPTPASNQTAFYFIDN